MDADASRVIVTPGTTADAAKAHHREFPEIRADGRSPREAASHLANMLGLALDTALTDWRRETLGRAIADVEAFLSQPE
ncbi:MAG: hypothetical protein U0790_16670 [Isosphaeraceae bacterium]